MTALLQSVRMNLGMINKVLSEHVTREHSPQSSVPRGQYARGILATLLLVLGLPMAIYFVSQPTLLRLTASQGNSVLTMVPPTKTVVEGAEDSFEVWLNPNGDNVSAVQLIINYDPSVIAINNVRPGSFFTDEIAIGQPVELIKNIETPGQITYSVSFPISSSLHSSTAIESAVIVEFTALMPGESPISFVTEGAIVTKVNSPEGTNSFSRATSGRVVVESLEN